MRHSCCCDFALRKRESLHTAPARLRAPVWLQKFGMLNMMHRYRLFVTVTAQLELSYRFVSDRH